MKLTLRQLFCQEILRIVFPANNLGTYTLADGYLFITFIESLKWFNSIKLFPMKTELPIEHCHTTGNIALRVGITGAGLLTLFYSILKVFVTAISLL